MIDSRTAPYGALLLRVTLGGLFLTHLALKLFVFTPAGTAAFFRQGRSAAGARLCRDDR